MTDPAPAVLAAVISCTDRAIPTPRQAQEGEVSTPTNAELAERAKGKTAREVIRRWLVMHPQPAHMTYGKWLDWATDNFLADPEIAQHLRQVTADQMSGTTTLALTADQLSETVQALYARLSETRHYLRSAASFTTGHADCCDVAKARAAVLADQRRDLEKREQDVLDAIDVLDPATDEDGSR